MTEEEYESTTGDRGFAQWLESRMAEEIKCGHRDCQPDNCMSSGTGCPLEPNAPRQALRDSGAVLNAVVGRVCCSCRYWVRSGDTEDGQCHVGDKAGTPPVPTDAHSRCQMWQPNAEAQI